MICYCLALSFYVVSIHWFTRARLSEAGPIFTVTKGTMACANRLITHGNAVSPGSVNMCVDSF